MATETTTISICDRCGRRWKDEDTFAYGHVRIDYSVKATDGAWGGEVRKFDLCGACITFVWQYLNNIEK